MFSISLEPDTFSPAEPADIVVHIMNSGLDACTDIRVSFELPRGVLRLRGEQRIHISFLRRGEAYSHQMRLRAQEEGAYQLRVTAFSYCDSSGEIIRPAEQLLRFRVAPSPKPQLASDPGTLMGVKDGSQVELPLLRRQLAAAEENLGLIEERKAQFVLETDVPLQLVKEERRLTERIKEIEARIELASQVR